jgi:Tfp pilus assembly protein PilX
MSSNGAWKVVLSLTTFTAMRMSTTVNRRSALGTKRTLQYAQVHPDLKKVEPRISGLVHPSASTLVWAASRCASDIDTRRTWPDAPQLLVL